MEKLQLTLLFKIIGIGSASGLVYLDEKLYIISDNSTFLYEYSMPNQKLNKIALTANAQENILKNEKSDFEAITNRGNQLIVLGSGSTEKRNEIFMCDTKSKSINRRDFTENYNQIKSQLEIKDDELNIEGLIATDKTIYFFQRGNGLTSKNGIIYADDSVGTPHFKFNIFNLPKINNVECSFTDAVLVDETIYFLACAEDTNSTYLDGEVLGSCIGSIDLKTMQLLQTKQITDSHKFEGLTLYKKTATEIEFLLCEDNDTELLESKIYSLKLNLNE